MFKIKVLLWLHDYLVYSYVNRIIDQQVQLNLRKQILPVVDCARTTKQSLPAMSTEGDHVRHLGDTTGHWYVMLAVYHWM